MTITMYGSRSRRVHPRTLVERLDVARRARGEPPVAVLHLADRPLERGLRPLGLGDDRDEQVRQAVVAGELDALEVHQDHPDLVGRRVAQQARDQRVDHDALAGARRARDEQVRHPGEVHGLGAARDVAARARTSAASPRHPRSPPRPGSAAARRSLNSLLGISMPTAALPGIGASIRMLRAASAIARSSDRPSMRLTLMWGAGWTSYWVTTGPALRADDPGLDVEAAQLLLMIAAFARGRFAVGRPGAAGRPGRAGRAAAAIHSIIVDRGRQVRGVGHVLGVAVPPAPSAAAGRRAGPPATAARPPRRRRPRPATPVPGPARTSTDRDPPRRPRRMPGLARRRRTRRSGRAPRPRRPRRHGPGGRTRAGRTRGGRGPWRRPPSRPCAGGSWRRASGRQRGAAARAARVAGDAASAGAGRTPRAGPPSDRRRGAARTRPGVVSSGSSGPTEEPADAARRRVSNWISWSRPEQARVRHRRCPAACRPQGAPGSLPGPHSTYQPASRSTNGSSQRPVPKNGTEVLRHQSVRLPSPGQQERDQRSRRRGPAGRCPPATGRPPARGRGTAAARAVRRRLARGCAPRARAGGARVGGRGVARVAIR